MRVGPGSAKRLVVIDMPTTCGCEDVVLARLARDSLIFPYSHNISDVIAAVMDSKGKAPALIYGIVNMEGHSKKRKAQATDSVVVVRSSKEVKTTMMTGAVIATVVMRVSMPLVVYDFDLANMELMTRSPLKTVSPTRSLPSIVLFLCIYIHFLRCVGGALAI